ncbi:MAG TPA: exonuclease SbcCD subunit D [Armatimonadota bacterium]
MHFADIHFGIETYGKLDPETGLNSRLVDFRDSLNYAIDRALESGVHLAVFAGDAYKTRDPSQTHQREFASCIRRLTDAGVPVVMVTGNHDLPNARSRANAIEIYRTVGVENVHIISRPQVILIETEAGPVNVAGMPYLLRSNILSREETKNKSIQETTDLMVQKYGEYIAFLAGECQQKDGVPSVLLGHFWIKNATVSSQGGYLNVAEPEVLVSTAANSAFDYVAMGHIHKFQDLNKRDHPPVVYCGSMDRIDFSERNEEKGFVLVDLEKGRADYQLVPVPARKFVEIDVDADVEDPTARILSAIGQNEIKDAVVKVLYHISQERLPLVREFELREALSSAFMVVSVTRDVVRDDRTARNKLLNESLDPVQALEMYFDTRDDLQKRKPELMEYARPLIDELLAEERLE